MAPCYRNYGRGIAGVPGAKRGSTKKGIDYCKRERHQQHCSGSGPLLHVCISCVQKSYCLLLHWDQLVLEDTMLLFYVSFIYIVLKFPYLAYDFESIYIAQNTYYIVIYKSCFTPFLTWHVLNGIQVFLMTELDLYNNYRIFILSHTELAYMLNAQFETAFICSTETECTVQ